MQKGTIIYLGNFELPDKNAAANRVMNNGKLFHALGYRVVYLGIVRDESFDGIRVSEYDDDIYEEAYPTSTKSWIRHIFDTSNIKAVAKRYDDVVMIITYNVPYTTFKAVKKAFKKASVTVAYDCTEWNSYAEGSLPKRLYKRIDEFEVRSLLGKKCKNIIVISRMMERQYKGCNVLRLPPLVDIDDPIWHQDREEHPGTFEFCFAGTINNKERLDRVVQAFCEMDDPDTRLRIIGLNRDEYTAAYPEQKDIVENNDRILFMGYVSHEESVRYVLSSSCYIFIREKTRRNEAGFPTKFAESYSCGVPIISTDVSDIKEYADDRIAILSDTSCETVKAAMLKMIGNSRNTKHNNLRNTFDYKNYLKETETWISRIH